MRGPVIAPRWIRSRMAVSMLSNEPRSRTVVTPDSKVFLAFSCARKTVTAGPSPQLLPGARPRRPVPIERHVGVDIDEARNASVAPQVHDLGRRRDSCVPRPHLHDAVS